MMGPKVGHVLLSDPSVPGYHGRHGCHDRTSFLFGWFGRSKNADLAPESLMKRLHPDIQAEFAKRPKLRRGFAKEMKMALKRSQAHGEEAIEDFRKLMNENIQELNRVAGEYGPEHLQQLLKHAEMTTTEQQQPSPLEMAQRLGIAAAPILMEPWWLRFSTKKSAKLKDFL
mmetsp:Transcript_1170/g.1274  ORF Transcript_1170/g.1274 Transcript_1170/m.1274 type:complete len:171 (+) Transcript_1170:46-558(+)